MVKLRHIILKLKEKIFRGRRKTTSVFLPVLLDYRQRILVLLPEGIKSPPLREIIGSFRGFFDGFPLQFVAPANRAGEIPPDLPCIYYSDESTTFTGNLVSAIAEDLAHHTYQLAIDLNERFSLIPALICRKSGAPVRIAFEKPRGNAYFNVFIRANGEVYASKLERMLAQLQAVTRRPEAAESQLDTVAVD